MNRIPSAVRAFIPLVAGCAAFIASYSPEPAPDHRAAGRSGAMEALEAWSAARAYPGTDIPPDRYLQAWEYARSGFRDLGVASRTSMIWEPIGPLNLQGRSRAVALNPLNPHTVYLGTASGGLWRSFTGTGGDWQQVRLGHPALGISAIDIHPADSNIIYLGTGEVYRHQIALGGLIVRTTRGSYGIGILKTTDGGSTWTKSLDWSLSQQRGIQRLVINPLNPSTVYAATTEGVYRTTDAGSTWSPVLTVIMAQDIVLHIPDTTRLLVSCGNFSSPGAGVYRSTDAGLTWAPAAGIPEFSGKAVFGAYRANNDIVFASVADSTTGEGSLYRTTDFGLTWTLRSTSATNGIYGVQGWYSHYPAVHPLNPDIVVHNSVNLSKSTDGGLTFSTPLGGYADNHSFAIHPDLPDVLYGVNDDGIYRSTDFGSSWTNIGFGVQSGQFYAGFSLSATDSTLGLVQSQDHIPGYRYLGSTVWDHDGAAVDEAGWTAINQSNDNIQYAVSRFGNGIYRSLNRGDSFGFLASFSTAGVWNSPVVIAASNPQILYVGKQKVFKSTNGGSSWAATNGNLVLDGNPVLSLAVSATSPDTAYAGTGPLVTAAHIYRTTNGGGVWTDVTGSLPDRYPLDLAVDPADSRTVYAAYGGFGAGHVFRTTDAGSTWTDVTGTLPDVPTGAVVVDPAQPSVVYAGNDIGVYVSTDRGASWAGFSEGLPDAVITSDLVISPANGTLRIGTHGNGAWQRRLYDGTPVPAFDYRPMEFQSPVAGTTFLPGSVLTAMTATFRNSGSQAQTDSFDVRYRILDGGAVLYDETKTIPGLGLSEQRSVIFSGPVTLTDMGVYTMEASVLAGDVNPANDTLRGVLEVIEPTITGLSVTKVHAMYVALAGGVPLASGDDVQTAAAIPFPVTLDGRTYDSLLVSSNGWVEFGTGPRGSPAGLSLPEDLGCCGANENGRLGIAARPTKAIGVWWEDLNMDLAGAAITTATLGASPGRTFVVEWKGMRAYYDAATTTRVSFQLRLHESGGIELAYGPVVPGTFVGADLGAMIGVKDHEGGDYHYYDIAAGGTGRAADVTTNLSPLADWPGPDSSYIIGAATSVSVGIQSGWNLISMPVLAADRSVAAVFPTAVPGTTFGYTGTTYVAQDSLTPGRGYWTRFPSALAQNVGGGALASLAIPVVPGWNLIGSVDHAVPAPAGGLVVSAVYAYADGYAPVATVLPGRGYWVKAATAGVVTLGGLDRTRGAHEETADAVHITLRGAHGSGQRLYLLRGEADAATLAMFAMPPAPPEGALAAHFPGDLLAARLAPEGETYSVVVTGAVPPVTITLEGARGASAIAAYGRSPEGERRVVVPEGAATHLAGFAGGDLRITLAGERTGAVEYALAPNYPNPFNPSTTISFSLRDAADVVLRVFDLQGREVATLVEGAMSAGGHTAKWDASEVAGGVYFVRLEAKAGGGGTTFRAVRKVLLLK